MVSTIDSLYFYCAMMREHHRHFSGKDTNNRKQSQIILDLFLTKEEGGLEHSQLSGNA